MAHHEKTDEQPLDRESVCGEAVPIEKQNQKPEQEDWLRAVEGIFAARLQVERGVRKHGQAIAVS